MRVVVTGAFGNIGVSTVKQLLEIDNHTGNPHKIVCLDILTKNTQKAEKSLKKLGSFETVWGSVTDKSVVEKALDNVDAVIHLAAILAPATKTKPELAYVVNVGGTKNVVDVASTKKSKAKIILASSISIYGPMKPSTKLTTASDPVNPTDVYTRTKAEAEKTVKESGLPWLILRLTAVPPLELAIGGQIEILFEMPLEQHIEFVHTTDAGTAFANAAIRDVKNKVLLIGGGKRNQMLNREFIKKYLETVRHRDAFRKCIQKTQKRQRLVLRQLARHTRITETTRIPKKHLRRIPTRNKTKNRMETTNHQTSKQNRQKIPRKKITIHQTVDSTVIKFQG